MWCVFSPLISRDPGRCSELDKDVIVKLFRITHGLAWQTMTAYLEYRGVELQQITPRSVIKAAFDIGIISDRKVWIDIYKNRTVMSRTYKKENLEKSIKLIFNEYGKALENLYDFMKVQGE